jgi:predicted DNA-binding transcriptional regulator AlpA
MTALPYAPPWMDQKTLAAHLSVKPSTIRTLMKHHGLPRPRQIGRIALWNWDAVDRWLQRGDGSKDIATEITNDVLAEREAADIQKSVRRLRVVAKV